MVSPELLEQFVEQIAERVAAAVLAELDARAVIIGESEFVSVDEAALMLRSARQRVYDLCSDGRLTRHKDGSRVLLRRSEILAHLNGDAHSLPTTGRGRMDRGMRG